MSVVSVILALGGPKGVEMCCEDPEAMTPWAPYRWLLGPHRLPLHLPWVAGSISSLAEEGRQMGE